MCKKKRDLECMLDFESLKMDEGERGLLTAAYTTSVYTYVCVCVHEYNAYVWVPTIKAMEKKS